MGYTPSFAAALFAQASESTTSSDKVYDGDWWQAREVDERHAFLEGVDDCLAWAVHAKPLPEVGHEFDEKITRYYKAHPEARGVPVVEVWRKLAQRTPPAKPTRGGEEWTNPHWDLNGLYWRQLNYESTQQAFLEGYLWCVRACLANPKETYSRPAAYYVHSISRYIETHPKTADDEAIAEILARFRDSTDQHQRAPDRRHQ
jgi:hypothetical protein